MIDPFSMAWKTFQFLYNNTWAKVIESVMDIFFTIFLLLFSITCYQFYTILMNIQNLFIIPVLLLLNTT